MLAEHSAHIREPNVGNLRVPEIASGQGDFEVELAEPVMHSDIPQGQSVGERTQQVSCIGTSAAARVSGATAIGHQSCCSRNVFSQFGGQIAGLRVGILQDRVHQ